MSVSSSGRPLLYKWRYHIMGFMALVIFLSRFSVHLPRLPLAPAELHRWPLSVASYELRARALRGGPQDFLYKEMVLYRGDEPVWREDKSLFLMPPRDREIPSVITGDRIIFSVAKYDGIHTDTLILRLLK